VRGVFVNFLYNFKHLFSNITDTAHSVARGAQLITDYAAITL
jgi:hypothetical protein